MITTLNQSAKKLLEGRQNTQTISGEFRNVKSNLIEVRNESTEFPKTE
jgi:hypothetical protein